MEGKSETLFEKLLSSFKNNKIVAILLLASALIGGAVKVLKDTSELKGLVFDQKVDKNILKTISIGKNLDFVIEKIGKPSIIEKGENNTKVMIWDMEDMVITGIVKDNTLREVEYKIAQGSNSIYNFYTYDGMVHPKDYKNDGTPIEYKPFGLLTYRDIIDNVHMFYVSFGSQGTPAFVKMKLQSHWARPYKQKEEYIIVHSNGIEDVDEILDEKINCLVIRFCKDEAFGLISGDEEDGWVTFTTLAEVKKIIDDSWKNNE